MRFPTAAELLLPIALALPFRFIRAEGTTLPFLKGVTVSCQTWGGEWQTPEMAQALDELKSLGVNSFAIHPSARISNDGHVRFRTMDDHRHVTQPLDWARELGMSAMVIPHI